MCYTANTNNYRALWSRLFICLAMLFVAATPPAGAATYLGKAEYLHRGGDPARVIDVVYVPIGFTSSYLYSAFTDKPTSAPFMNFSPFASYPSFFNIHRLDAYAALGEEAALRSLAIQNLPDVDLIIFVHIDAIREYSSSGGDVHINYGSSNATLIHELGHALGQLADEYEEAAKCPSGVYGELVEPNQINVTINTDRSTLKWREWLGIDGVDLFQGGLYCSAGIYRPRTTCLMRDASWPAQPFDPVCREGLIRQINAHVNSTISQTPGLMDLNGVAPQIVTLSIEPDLSLRPQGASFEYKWVLSGSGEPQILSNGPATSITIDLGALVPDVTYALQVYHADPDINNYMHISSLDALSSQLADRGWFVRVNAASTPTIASFTPTAAGVGAIVSITGTNFTGATAVKFNGTSSQFQVISATQINATIPTGATTGKITVTTPGGTAISAGTFTVLPPPTISMFSPSVGTVGTYVYITGNNFCYQQCNTVAPTETTVRVNGVAATSIQWMTSTYILFQVPAGATTGRITVTTPGGTTTSVGTFTVIPPPTISSFSPASGPVGTAMNLSGTNLCVNQCYVSASTETQIRLNSMVITPFWITPNFILFYVPPGATTGKITVTTPGGTASSAGTFMVIP